MLSNNTKDANESSVAFLRSPSFLKRFLTTMILAPFGLWVLYLGPPASLYLCALFYIGMICEWTLLVGRAVQSLTTKVLWFLLGIGYISGGVWGFYAYYLVNPLKALLLLLVIWTTDIGAYFAGKIIGGPKLCPSVSPNKTWAGSIGGTLASVIVILLFASMNADFRTLPLIVGFIALSIIGQLGDLLESFVKRHFQVKDASSLLPGHGGLLDRFDSLLAVGVVLLVFGFI